MSHDDLSPDDPDVDAYERSMELRSLLKSLKLPSDTDPYKIMRLPNDDRNRDTEHVSLRMPIPMKRIIDRLHGYGGRFQSRSEYINHYCAIGLKIEAALSPDEDAIRALYDPVIGRMELQSALIELAALDEIIAMSRVNIGSTSRAVREKARIELLRAKRICEDHDDVYRLGLVNQILSYQS